MTNQFFCFAQMKLLSDVARIRIDWKQRILFTILSFQLLLLFITVTCYNQEPVPISNSIENMMDQISDTKLKRIDQLQHMPSNIVIII